MPPPADYFQTQVRISVQNETDILLIIISVTYLFSVSISVCCKAWLNVN